MSVFAAVQNSAARPESIAIVVSGRVWRHRDLWQAAETFASFLLQRDDPTEPLAAMLSDPDATAVVMLGCDAAGVPLVHLDPATVDLPHNAVVYDRSVEDARAWEIPGTAARLWLRDPPGGEQATRPPPGTQTFLTSGSTGTPVGVVRHAEAMLADARRVADFLRYEPDRPVVVSAPVFHVYGINYGLLGTLLSGAPARYVSTRSIPSQLARAVQEHDARTLIGLPFHFGQLASEAVRAGTTLGAGLRGLAQAVSAGAPLADGVAATIAAECEFTLFNCYGSSEAGAVTLQQVTGEEDPGMIGTPLPGVSAKLGPFADATGPGELLLTSDSLAMGRLGPTGLTTLREPDGWYRTGDLARIDPGEDIRLAGRVGRLINVAGKKVNPSEIERVLSAHPGVAEAHVAAEPDATRGQVPVARVVLRDPAVATAELVGWCRERLQPHQLPRRFDLVDQLPRSATGKVVSGSADGAQP